MSENNNIIDKIDKTKLATATTKALKSVKEENRRQKIKRVSASAAMEIQ